MSSAGIPDLVELLNTLSASLNVFYPLIKRDLPGCRVLVFSPSLYEAVFSHAEPWHSFVISVWLSRTGAAGVKFVVRAEDEERGGLLQKLHVQRHLKSSALYICGICSLSKRFHSYAMYCRPHPILLAWNTPHQQPCPITSMTVWQLHRNMPFTGTTNCLAGENQRLGRCVLPLCMQRVRHLVLQQHSHERHAPTS